MNSIAVDTAEGKGTIQGRAMELLGAGVGQEAVASALGVTASYISQLLSDTGFASKVTALKYEALAAHTERDAKYDSIEDTLLTKLERSVNLMLRPADILGAIKVINGAKRRGNDSQESIIQQNNIVEITMPIQIVNDFTTNINNQVIKAGDQELVTIQSSKLLKTMESESPNTVATHATHKLTNEVYTPDKIPEATTNIITNPESNAVLDSL